MPFHSGVSLLALISALIASYEVSLPRRAVRSTTDTSGVGTRKAMPVSFPLSAGITLPTALAAPVDAGMMFSLAQRPARQSFPPRDGPSTESWFAVIACTVVIKPSTIPKLSWMTFASGARQFVVHDALLTTFSADVYEVWFTPITNIGASPDGAEMITFFAPPPRCRPAFSLPVKTPVDSHTMSAPASPHGMLAGSFTAKTFTFI